MECKFSGWETMLVYFVVGLLPAITGWAACYAIDAKRKMAELELDWLRQAKIETEKLAP
jgi:hypothetical protein